MRAKSYLTTGTAILIVLLSTGTVMSLMAPVMPDRETGGIVQVVTSGSPGRIARFLNSTDLGDSLIHQRGPNLGIGTILPTSRLDIRGATNALAIQGITPMVGFLDTAAGGGRFRVQAQGGGVRFLGEDALSGTNADAFMRIDRAGRVGFAGATSPTRAIQIGPSFDAMFTIEPSDASPRAGFIRFGDKTGWQLRIGRSREFSGGPLNTGLTGATFTFRDDGAFGPTSYPLLATGVEPLCRTLANFVTRCASTSSSLRYKKDIRPYVGGLDVVERLQPIAFTRIESGADGIGLGAEDVEKIEPRLIFRNEQGEADGIHYELLTTALINAVKEQQAEIEQLKAALAKIGEPSPERSPDELAQP